MLKNYIITAVRNVVRDRLFSFINIFGLAVGFAACIMIFLFVWSELNYDSWVPDSDRIYRTESVYTPMGREPLPVASVPGPIRDALLNDYPSEIIEASRIFAGPPQSVRVGEKVFQENVNYVDPSFFNIFPMEVIAGDVELALADTSSLIISQRMAEKYFGTEPAMGEIITIIRPVGSADFRVGAIVKDIPDESHMTGDIFALLDPILFEQIFPGIMTNWSAPVAFTYVKLAPGADAEALQSDFADFSDRHGIKPTIASYADYPAHNYFLMHLENIRDIHLDETLVNDMKPHGSISVIYAFGGIALLLLLIASVNFVNLATARSLKRTKEVALRKTLGANRPQLILQFVGEAILTVAASAVIALGLVELLLPWYNGLLNTQLGLATLFTPLGVTLLGMFVIIIGVLSGIYPALFVSGVKPARVLHANKSDSTGSVLLRTALVTFQFSVAIALIAATVILYRQTSFMTSLDQGFQTENIAVIGMPFSSQVHEDSLRFRRELDRIPGVVSTGISSQVLTQPAQGGVAVIPPIGDTRESISIPNVLVGYGFFETYGIEPVAGRLLSEDFGSDILPFDQNQRQGSFEGNMVVNESTVRRLGYASPEAIVGQVMKINTPTGLELNLEVVGVVKDVLFGSARDSQQPAIFYYAPTFLTTISARIEAASVPAVNAAIEGLWQRLQPDNPLNLLYVEDMIDASYDAENRQRNILTAFSVLTVIVASLGLFGLAAFTAERRTKEVGIRKVMGANNMDIVSLFVWSLSKPIVVANLIAWPVGWYYMSDWLSGFVYRIDMSVLPFVIAGVAVAAFGALTVASRTFKVARSLPVVALRYE
jgi:putative ABC transport system permease protein